MNNFCKVTILGALIGILMLNIGCPNTSQVRQEPAASEIRALKEREVEARISQGIDYFEKGELDHARLILKQVLADNPDHPEAVKQWRRVTQPVYCTIYTGDTLSEIAQYYYNDPDKWQILAQVNNVPRAKALRRHQRLQVPLFRAYQEGRDELGRIQKRFFNDDNPIKILMYPIQEGDHLKGLAKQFYGRNELSYFLSDFNVLEQEARLIPGKSLKIPIFPKNHKAQAEKERKRMNKGRAAMKKKNYLTAHTQFSRIPKESSFYKETRQLLKKCKTAGVAYYEKRGDRAFEAGDPGDAGKYWKMGLALAPHRKDLKKKIQDAKDLVKALESLPDM